MKKLLAFIFSRCNDSITLCLRIFQRRSRRFHISERKFGSRRGSTASDIKVGCIMIGDENRRLH